MGHVGRRRGRPESAELGLNAGVAALGFSAATWLVFGSFAELVQRIRLFRAPFGSSLSRLAGQPLSVWGGAIAHAGMGLTIAGIAGMSLAQSTIVAVKPGQTIELAGYEWTLLGLHDETGPNFNSRIADIRVTRNGNEIGLFHPSRNAFTTQTMTVTNTAIRTSLFADLYMVLGEEHDGTAVLRLHYNFLAPWIWLGALTMAFGGLLSLLDRRLRVGAPARSGPRCRQGRGGMIPLNRRLVLLLPLGMVGITGVGLYSMLDRMRAGKFDPRGVPSALVGKPVPSFSLPGQASNPGFGSSELTGLGRPVLLNFFASWCVPIV